MSSTRIGQTDVIAGSGLGSAFASDRPSIVHVSGDFPDPIDPFKTPVIRTLVDLTSDRFRHYVFSINRKSGGAAQLACILTQKFDDKLLLEDRAFDHGRALTYSAPSRGIFHASVLRGLGDRLADMLIARGGVDLLVGHKLTIEGIAVRRAALRLGVPFAISIQGDTDTKILAARPDLRGEFRKIFHEASMVFPFAPWALKACESTLGRRAGPSELLPCPTELDQPIAPCPGGESFASVFHLRNYRRKNLQGLARAMKLRGQAGLPGSLSIIGGGEPGDLARCRNMTADLDTIDFEGALERDRLPRRLNRAKGFVLPSLRESFGLVFIEALFAGLPIIYPKGAAIDGYFDDYPFAIAVDARDPAAIAEAMDILMRDENRLKSDLLAWQNGPHSRRFTRDAIARTFEQGLLACLR